MNIKIKIQWPVTDRLQPNTKWQLSYLQLHLDRQPAPYVGKGHCWLQPLPYNPTLQALNTMKLWNVIFYHAENQRFFFLNTNECICYGCYSKRIQNSTSDRLVLKKNSKNEWFFKNKSIYLSKKSRYWYLDYLNYQYVYDFTSKLTIPSVLWNKLTHYIIVNMYQWHVGSQTICCLLWTLLRLNNLFCQCFRLQSWF